MHWDRVWRGIGRAPYRDRSYKRIACIKHLIKRAAEKAVHRSILSQSVQAYGVHLATEPRGCGDRRRHGAERKQRGSRETAEDQALVTWPHRMSVHSRSRAICPLSSISAICGPKG